MTAIRTRKSGFTLVEILIVVIILGILAAIVIPQFTSASEDARKANMASQLQTLRSQVELYRLQHLDKAPESAEFWAVMTTCTNAAGDLKTTAPVTVPDATYKFGPYCMQPMKSPITGYDTLSTAATPADDDGWYYHETTGRLHGISRNPDTGVLFWSDDGNEQVTTLP